MTMSMHVSDLPLFARSDEPVFVTAPSNALEVQYASWYRKNPHVFSALERAALKRYREGATRISIAKLYEDLREDPTVETKGGGYKMNNSRRSYTSRHLMWKHPEWGDLFETRTLTHALKKERAVG